MNERIKELAKQADGVFIHKLITGAKQYTFLESDLERFAELIVRECMRMCDVAAVGYETHGHTKEANGCYSAKEYIEEHFGVK